MRRALNVLQACHAAYDITGEAEIYNCTGNPHPSDIDTIVGSMLSDEFTAAFKSASSSLRNAILINFTVINIMKTERGLALQDLLTGTYEYIETIELKPHARIYLLDFLATLEYITLFTSVIYAHIHASDIDFRLAPMNECNCQPFSAPLRTLLSYLTKLHETCTLFPK